MNSYEKSIGLKTIWLMITRRFEYILFVFVPIALTTLIVTQFVLTKTYQSSTTVTTASDLTSNFQLFQTYASKDEVLNPTVEKLQAEKGITLSASDIKNGLAFTAPTTNNKFSGKISFTFKKSNYVQPVMEVFSTEIVEYAKMADNGKFGSMTVSAATKASKNSSENKYLLIGLAAGLVVALGIAFIDEIISDEVYDKKDVELLGCEAFELSASKLNGQKVDGDKYGSYKI